MLHISCDAMLLYLLWCHTLIKNAVSSLESLSKYEQKHHYTKQVWLLHEEEQRDGVEEVDGLNRGLNSPTQSPGSRRAWAWPA